MAWDRVPEQAANSHPELIGRLVKILLDGGAREVIVTDNPCNSAERVFHRSGIAAAARQAGAKVPIMAESDYILTAINGLRLKQWEMSKFLHQVDKVINVPIIKHHSLAGATMAMKNWYGMIGGRRGGLHQVINESIAELASTVKPTLTILDATRVLMSNGPSGGSLSDVKNFHTIIAGVDEVALDALGATYLGQSASTLPYLAMGQKLGAGSLNYQELRLEDIKI
jgi:uncharacterized protein (DUF362 family)